MSLEALQAQFDLHVSSTNGRIKNVEAKLEQKLDKDVFYWILAALLTILTAMFGFTNLKLDAIQKNGDETKSSVANIQGKLDPYKLEFQK